MPPPKYTFVELKRAVWDAEYMYNWQANAKSPDFRTMHKLHEALRSIVNAKPDIDQAIKLIERERRSLPAEVRNDLTDFHGQLAAGGGTSKDRQRDEEFTSSLKSLASSPFGDAKTKARMELDDAPTKGKALAEASAKAKASPKKRSPIAPSLRVYKGQGWGFRWFDGQYGRGLPMIQRVGRLVRHILQVPEHPPSRPGELDVEGARPRCLLYLLDAIKEGRPISIFYPASGGDEVEHTGLKVHDRPEYTEDSGSRV